jgi:hypothetical protein
MMDNITVVKKQENMFGNAPFSIGNETIREGEFWILQLFQGCNVRGSKEVRM